MYFYNKQRYELIRVYFKKEYVQQKLEEKKAAFKTRYYVVGFFGIACFICVMKFFKFF